MVRPSASCERQDLPIVRVEHHHLNPGKAPFNNSHQLFCVEVGQATVQIQQLPVAALEFHECIGAAGGLLHRPSAFMKAVQNSFAKAGAGTRYQHSAMLRSNQAWNRHVTYLKRGRLNCD